LKHVGLDNVIPWPFEAASGNVTVMATLYIAQALETPNKYSMSGLAETVIQQKYCGRCTLFWSQTLQEAQLYVYVLFTLDVHNFDFVVPATDVDSIM